MKSKLVTQKCTVCNENTTRISNDNLKIFLKEIPGWTIVFQDNVMTLEKVFTFKNYKLAWLFANKVSELAENEFHHPSLLLEWGQVTVTWYTHAIKGIHKNDFICAAKTDRLM